MGCAVQYAGTVLCCRHRNVMTVILSQETAVLPAVELSRTTIALGVPQVRLYALTTSP